MSSVCMKFPKQEIGAAPKAENVLSDYTKPRCLRDVNRKICRIKEGRTARFCVLQIQNSGFPKRKSLIIKLLDENRTRGGRVGRFRRNSWHEAPQPRTVFSSY